MTDLSTPTTPLAGSARHLAGRIAQAQIDARAADAPATFRTCAAAAGVWATWCAA